MNTDANQAWTRGYDQFGRLCWYNKATGKVHHPLQSAAHGPRQRQVQQGLTMTCGHHVGRSGVCSGRSTAAKGSYYNPLAADMAVWGILIQRPRSDDAQGTWRSATGWRRMTWSNTRVLEPKKALTKPAQTKPLQEWTRGKPASNGSMPPPPPVARLRKAATR